MLKAPELFAGFLRLAQPLLLTHPRISYEGSGGCFTRWWIVLDHATDKRVLHSVSSPSFNPEGFRRCI
jgi:hypothetical protein